MRNYFSYGSNMISGHMMVRCPDARFAGVASLHDHAFVICRSGYASVRPQPGSKVWGVLWEVSATDEAELDEYEGVEEGLYSRLELPVRTASGSEVSALCYVGDDYSEGRLDRVYLKSIIEAAVEHDLPRDYIDQLRALLQREPGGPA